jgi:hypothetical protein
MQRMLKSKRPPKRNSLDLLEGAGKKRVGGRGSLRLGMRMFFGSFGIVLVVDYIFLGKLLRFLYTIKFYKHSFIEIIS